MRDLVVDPLEDRDGILHIGGVSSIELADRYGTPLYVIDEDRIRANYRRIQGAFRRRYANTRVHYAVKANTNLAVLAILRQEGAGADCSCPAEIDFARRAGFPSGDILYTGAYPSREEIAFACDAGVMINLDSDARLDEIAERDPRPILSFRVNPGPGKGKHGLVFSGPDAKFGLPPDRIVEAFQKAQAEGFERFGIHMMTGSCVLDPAYFPEATARLLEIAGTIAAKVGISFEFVDIGGGFGVPYEPTELPLPIDRVATDTVAAFEEGCDTYSLGRPRFILEPGRYLVCDAGVLLTRVQVVKHGRTTFVGVDAGMNTLLRPALYDAYHPVVAANRLRDAADGPVMVVGPVCENTDVLARDRPLPAMREGDVLAILNAGAYGFAMSSQYNNRPRAAEVLVHSRTHEVVREREGFADLTQRQRIPGRLFR
jgi:diaminopimelate decarboxylase